MLAIGLGDEEPVVITVPVASELRKKLADASSEYTTMVRAAEAKRVEAAQRLLGDVGVVISQENGVRRSTPWPVTIRRSVNALSTLRSDRRELYGCRFLTVRVEPAVAHDAQGGPTLSGPRKFHTPGLSNVMAVALVGDFEGVVSIGIGARKQRKVRVFTLSSPTRVVIDIPH